MKKKNGQKRLMIFTAVNIAISFTLFLATVWVYIVTDEKLPLSPATILLYVLLIGRIVLDYFHDRIKNKKSRLYLQSEIDRLTERIHEKDGHISQLCEIINKLEPKYDILSEVTIFGIVK